MSDIVLPNRVACAMAERLDANSHKSGWERMTPRQLLRRAEQEMGELRRALIAGESPERIDEECGDVANFLGMLMTNYREIVADAAPHPETPR